MVLVYTHKITNRIRYTFSTLFTQILQAAVEFTDDQDHFISSNGPKINYSNAKIGDELFIRAHTLLFEIGLKEQSIQFFEYETTKGFFKIDDNHSCFPFDIFAASFYLLSRYEEYLPHKRDHHDRFMAHESIAFQNEVLAYPLVDMWTRQLAKQIKQAFPEFDPVERNYQFLPTIDIDNAYAYKNKGLLRTIGSLCRSGVSNLFELKQKINVLTGKEKDPYDTYVYQFKVHQKYDITPIYFFLMGDYGLNDKNIPVSNQNFQSLVKSINDYYPVGIHPSYNSNRNVSLLKKEIDRLQNITHREIVKSRQHFLKLTLPDTYRNLIDHGITEDYSMGYAEEPGFRAGTCTPYYFYDIDTESKTTLQIYPFCMMEATFQYYKKLSIEEILVETENLINKVKEVKGTFISIWHNESLSNQDIWKGWRELYERIIMQAKET